MLKLAIEGVVSAPLWNSEQRIFAGMLTVSDIIHLIQYYYYTLSSYDVAAAEVEEFRLESLRGKLARLRCVVCLLMYMSHQTSSEGSMFLLRLCCLYTLCDRSLRRARC